LADCWICNFLSFVVSIKRHRQLWLQAIRLYHFGFE
jgi:hypothetical protein